jgi:phosphoribosylaminoimidazole-succinocarboxamide synthase
MTSVKQFRIEEPATADAPGRGRFVFTDAYSVFDWGRMPDSVPEKGRSLCSMGAYNFELLEADGIPTHYRGVVDPTADETGEEPEAVELDEVAAPPREMAIDLVRVPGLPAEDGSYDYETFHATTGTNYLVPLETVFRNSVPMGSSLRSRRDPGEVGLDAAEWSDEPVDLPEPVVEFSTKFEEQDRYLAREEADRIAGRAALDDLAAIAREVNRVVTDRAESVGMAHEDGKIECCYVDGEVRVADVVGTFDENRFSYDGRQLSKEVLRQHHKRTQPEWVAGVDAAKTEADEQGETDWRALCERDPEPLDASVIDAASDLYTAGANVYLDRELFDAPDIDDAVATVRSLGN